MRKTFGLVNTNPLTIINNPNGSVKNLRVKGFTFPNIDILIISDKHPSEIKAGLVFSLSISIGEAKSDRSENDDPSTIYYKLPIDKPGNPNSIESPGYYPSYAGLNPEQRWIYLNWLQDVTQEVDIGYVFIYYYGLERHLLTQKYDRAFDEILKLREYHQNNSFLSYSEASLVNSSLLMKRTDKLTLLLDNNVISDFSNSLFLIAYNNNYNLSTQNLMHIFNRISGLNRRYIRQDRKQFQNILSEVLIERFGNDSFPFASNYSADETTNARYPLFANYSLPDSLRTPDLPDYYAHARLIHDLKGVFQITHDRFKAWNAEQRRAKAMETSPKRRGSGHRALSGPPDNPT